MLISETASAEADLVDLYLSRAIDFGAKHKMDYETEFLRIYVGCVPPGAYPVPRRWCAAISHIC